LLVWSVCPCLVYGQDTELKSVKGKAAIREYDKTTEELAKEYQKKLEDLDREFRMKSELVRSRLLSNLKEALTEEARKVNLPEANKIDAEIKYYTEIPLPIVSGNSTGPRKTQIPRSALSFRGHHYAVVTKPMTWHSARDYAESLGGYLVRIDSNVEQQFIEKTFEKGRNTGLLWIDGNDELTEGRWIFSNGKPVKFFNWAKPEPTNTKSKEHVIALNPSNRFLWADVPSTGRCRFIIEWDE